MPERLQIPLKSGIFANMTDIPMITILGPTACGKTSFAAALAHDLGAEIISADSRQVYRGMDIGTGKDLDDYVVNGQAIPYHLIDIAEPGTKYNLFEYQRDFHEALTDVRSRGVPVILCGGTGLYIEAVLKGYALSPVPQNPKLREALAPLSLQELTQMLSQLKQLTGTTMHNTTDVDTAQRAIRAIEIESYNLEHPLPQRSMDAVPSLVIGLNIDREERRRRISERLQTRLANGLSEEVEALLRKGIPADDLIYYGLEYKYVTLHVLGKLTQEEMYRSLEIAIHQFAKRQMTWFRGMERRGCTINWIDADLPMTEKIAQVRSLLDDYSKTDAN